MQARMPASGPMKALGKRTETLWHQPAMPHHQLDVTPRCLLGSQSNHASVGPCPHNGQAADSSRRAFHNQQPQLATTMAAVTVLMATTAQPAEAQAEQETAQGSGSRAEDEGQGSNPTSQQQEKRRRLKPRELGRLLHMSDEAAMLLIERVPELVRHPVHRLQASLQRLAQALKVDDKTACALAVKQPRALLIPADQVVLRLTDLAALLKVKDVEARELVQQQPGLLTHQPDILRARLAALITLVKEAVAQDTAGMPGGGGGGGRQGLSAPPAISQPAVNAANMCRREPGLLTLSHSQLVLRLTALSAALGSPGSLVPALQLAAQAPTAVLLPPTRPASLVATLATILSLPTRAAGDLLVRLPQLLTVAPETLAGNMRGLSLALGVEREAAAVMCAEQPGLLLIKTNDMPARLKALESALGVSHERVTQLVTAKPQLLLKEPAAVEAALKKARKRGEL